MMIMMQVVHLFRTLLSAHVTACAPRVGAGRILQQALRGGVYRWLQQMCSKHFNHLVQVRRDVVGSSPVAVIRLIVANFHDYFRIISIRF